jgi:hypothetical protein
VQQWVSATLLQNYKIFLLFLITISIKYYICVPVFLTYLSFMQISSLLCRHLYHIFPHYFINGKKNSEEKIFNIKLCFDFQYNFYLKYFSISNKFGEILL